MSEHIHSLTFKHVIICNKRDCNELVESREATDVLGTFALADEHAKLRAAQGWRVYASRGRRWYCPIHGPSRDGLQYDVTPRSTALADSTEGALHA